MRDPAAVSRPAGPKPVPAAWRGLGGLALALSAVLLAVSGRYGYSRDELYFLRAGQALAFGYVDQPPLTPLLARAASEVFGDSLIGLRMLPAALAGLVVLCTGLLCRELGGGRGAQLLAAGAMAVAAYLLAVGHLLSTSTVDLLAWTALSLLVVRALRGGGRSWLWVGIVAGIGLQNKILVAFLLAALLFGLLLVGPRAPLRTPWPWLAGLLALALWSPYLAWQAANGFPQLELSRAIAAGSSGTSEPRWLFLPFQLVLVSPLLIPVWVAGLWRLARDPRLAVYRAFAAAYAFLVVVFLLTGGKPYYLAGFFPVLLAAGAEPTLRWVAAGAGRVRAGVLAGALTLSAAASAFLFLPLVPVSQLANTPILAVNYDAGETVGWPELARTVAGVVAGLPAEERVDVALLARNYGEAGAIDRYRGELDLPPVYSGHNSYHDWGPPPEGSAPVVVVGYGRERLLDWFGTVELATRIDNGVGLDNDEQGVAVWVCRDRRASWAELWPDVRRLG